MSAHHVESRHLTITAITDALTGIVTPAIMATETVSINPITGTKTYTITTSMERTVDGRLVKPDAALICRSCGKTVSPVASRACTACAVTLCAHCAGDPAQCAPCRWYDRLRRFLQWLTTLSTNTTNTR